jgi:FKBP-type peptidyl-prolyl cis-trans isomerase (trigger factor)
MSNFNNLKVEKLPESEAVIIGSLTVEFLAACRPEALKHLNSLANIPGFRAGHIPEDVLIKKVGEMGILEEVAEVALGREYASIITEAKLTPVSRPEISITKLAPGTPLEFKIKVALEPEFDLPDYMQIAKDINKEYKGESNEATDTDVDALLLKLRMDKAHHDLHEKIGHDNHGHAPIKDEELPPLDDEFAQSVGEFIDLADLKMKAKENLSKEKQFRAKEKNRLKIVETLVAATDIPLPSALVASEQEKMFAQFKDDVVRAGMKFEDYMKSVKKSEAEVKEEWRPKAVERVKSELIVTKIAEKEKIEPKAEDLEVEAKHLLEHYPDADPLRARVYVYTMMRNQKVLEYLETL